MQRTVMRSFAGNGHHFKSWAGPLSTHMTISQHMSPASGAFWSTSIASSAEVDGPRLQICMQAKDGREVRQPIVGE